MHENRTEAKTFSVTWSGFLVLLGVEEEFDWRFLRRKSSEVNFCRASSSLGKRGRLRTGKISCATVVRLLEKCLSVSSFHFTTPELRPSGPAGAHARCIYWTCVCVHRGSACLIWSSGVPDGIPERAFARACMAWLNHSRSTKVLYSNINSLELFLKIPAQLRLRI